MARVSERFTCCQERITMKFNTAVSYDFPPELHIEGLENNLEVVTEMGIMITNDLEFFFLNFDYILLGPLLECQFQIHHNNAMP